jgi:uncharacterized protein YqhQ
MKEGYKSLMRSAEIYGLEEAEEELKKEKEAKKAAKKAAKQEKQGKTVTLDEKSAEVTVDITDENSAVNTEAVDNTVATDKADKKDAKAKKEKKAKKEESSTLSIIVTVCSILAALVIFVGLFMMLPSAIYGWCAPILPTAITGNVILNSFAKSAFEGGMRVILLVGYMLVVSLMKDIKRTFMYHGAEHKTIFCYEAGLELTVDNVRKQPRHHPRCGTSFLFVVIIVSILVSTVVFSIWPITNALLRFVAHLVMLPLIVGVSYEFNRWAGRHDNGLTRVLTAPGLWLQNFTTFEPDDSMIEVGIQALELVLPEEKGTDAW